MYMATTLQTEIETIPCDLNLNQLFTYHLITEDEEDEKGIKEMLYKIQLLELFYLQDFEENQCRKGRRRPQARELAQAGALQLAHQFRLQVCK